MRPSRLSLKEWAGVFERTARASLDDNVPLIASALAYSSFLAIPSALLLVLGVFSLLAEPGTIVRLIDHLETVVPAEAANLLEDGLRRLQASERAGVAIALVGGVLALWSLSGAMSSYMTGLNIAYERKDRRGFVRRRLVALLMIGCVGAAVVPISVFLVFGPMVERSLGDWLEIEGALKYVWWTVQWPVLLAGLLVAFEAMYWLGPDLDEKRWRPISAGSLTAALAWLALSGGLALYAAEFGSFNKTWGTLSAVIVTLIWLWASGLALLFGAELNRELERLPWRSGSAGRSAGRS